MSSSRNGLYPALPRHRIEALGIQTSYHVSGQAGNPTALLLHGMSASADSFRELMHELAPDHRLVAPDIPGFGFSQNTEPYTVTHLVEWLAAFMQKLELRPAHLLGHSFGGVLASAFTVDYPEDVRRLALLAPAILVPAHFPEWLRKVSNSLGLMRAGVALSRVRLERQIRVQFHEPERMDENVWARRRIDYANARASASAMRAVASYDVRPQLAEISQPTTVIWGRNDPVLSVAGASEIGRLLPEAEVHLLQGCGHVPMLERPTEVQGILREFLR